MQNMPRVVENQKVKFDTDVLLKQLQVDSEVGGKSKHVQFYTIMAIALYIRCINRHL